MKGQRPKRKVVLFLVEGQSEINALKPTISALYDSIDPNVEVFFPTMIENGDDIRGDITSKFGIHPNVIEKCIDKLFLKTFYDREKLYPKDITEIIHLVDLDGAYISDDCIVLGENPTGNDKPYYTENNIMVSNVDSIVQRNQRKRDNLNYLSALTEIHTGSKRPKYSAFFFSSNLDHFLYGNANLSPQEKANRASEYAAQFELDPNSFVSSIKSTPGVLLGMDYSQSWQFIQQENRSLHRHSNINILFDRLLSEINPQNNN